MDEAAEWHRIAEERRRQLERLQSQPLYRTAAAALAAARRLSHVVARTIEPPRRAGVLLGRSALALPGRLRARDHEQALRESLRRLPAPGRMAASAAEVTAVIVTASQPQRLDGLLAALGRLEVTTLVVDNAGVGDNARVIAAHPHARRIALDAPLRYAEANERAIAEVATPWILLLNDDVMPLDDLWLARMLAAADPDTVAVGAQLVHGTRGLLGGDAVDGQVQHAGIGLVLDGPLARAIHLGRGALPVVEDAVRTVPAATAACLLVRADAHRAVGGFHAGFDYGSEDVDLCLRLAAQGTLRVALGAVLLHEEGATRLSASRGGERRARARRQAANRALLDARHAPQLRRRVAEAALGSTGDGVASAVRLVIGVAGSTPGLLDRSVREHAAVRLVPGTSGAVVLVTDPARLPDRDVDVPVVGWVGDGRPAAAWTEQQLGRLDALVIEGVAAPASPSPSPPIHRVEDVDGLRTALRAVLNAPRWSLRIGAPSERRGGAAGARWGDGPVAEVLARELRAHGVVARISPRDRWGDGADRTADVTLHLKGRGVAPTAAAQLDVVWVMSHPSELAPGELDAADLVLAGSDLLADRYRARTATPVATLPQAADARRFTAGDVDRERASRALFVGNTRSVPRPVVLGAVDAGIPLTLIGAGWERYLDPRLVACDHIPYAELPAWYRSADVVLNDHWDDMARWGLVSNRVFDALACGTCVVSDAVPGIDALLDDAVVTFHDQAEVGAVIRRLLDDPEERAARAERGRRAVLARHTWEQRAATLVQLVADVSRTPGRSGHADPSGPSDPEERP